ncbi:MAG TPA: tRNA (adenosine(37)-N6)-threonylcarbamoyltransferase complex transferase subunit TsaD [Candidatus Udaeobacter sp.]|nr:tRNA (adenosine(37)-N6)-threonylcarbamoyltransferase complex transferase subunit TsaD [Candidatus Udaeobacter sp.]
MNTVLALETSCDETAVAILRGDRFGHELLASEVASQVAAHEKYGGIVPEIASRNHLVYAPRLMDRVAWAAKIRLSEIDVFAATSGPGLASSLMIGASIAKGLAIGFGKRYLAINHLEGHLLSPFFGVKKDGDTDVTPNVSLMVSGGHTMLVVVRGLTNYQVIGHTVDDAAGEAFDKVAKLLGLGYPGGPEIEKHARGGDPKRFDFPRSMLGSENFSFSGLKTAVRYLLPKLNVIPSEVEDSRGLAKREFRRGASTSLRFAWDKKLLSDLCASFQQAIIDVLVIKTIAAAEKYRLDLVTISGGVSCNQELRRQMRDASCRKGMEFKSAEPWLCTDNAAMIAFVALLRLRAGFESHVTEEIDPNLALVL